MEHEYKFLIEKEEIWAKMLMDVLKDHKIPCTARPVYGAGLVIRAGMQERLKLYVPEELYSQAQDLAKELFS